MPPPGTDLTVARPRPATIAARSAPPLAAWLLLALLAVHQADRANAAETAYLALWIVVALLPAAVLARTPAWENTLGAALAVLAVWALPAGPARSAAVGALLLAALALAAAQAIGAASAMGDARGAGAPRGVGASRHEAPDARESLALTLPLAVGTQALLRGELLLAPGAAEIAALVAPPAVGAFALALLAARCGLPAALLAGAVTVTLGQGWTAITILALAGVAVGAEAASLFDSHEVGSPAPEVPADREASAAPRPRRPWKGSITAPLALGLALLAGGLATETRAAAAALAAAAVIALARPHRRAAGFALLLFVAAFPAVAALASLRAWPDALRLLAWVPILLPALAWAPALPRARWPPLAAAVSLAAAGALAVPEPAAPAAGLAALAVLLTKRGRSEGGELSRIGTASAPETSHAERWTAVAGAETASRPDTSHPEPAPVVPAHATARRGLGNGLLAAWTAQWVWSAALLAGTAVLASYPWLRPAPAADALALVGLTLGWVAGAVLAALALAIGLGFGARAVTRRLVGRRPAAWATATVIGVALFAALPPPARPVLTGAAALGPQRPRVVVELDGSPARTVAVFSNLSGAAELDAGTVVASVRLLDDGGEPLVRRLLRAGEDTGEWAARRPDVAALPDLAAPPAWTCWVESGGGEDAAGEPFFGQLYRARWTAQPPAPAARLVIERNPALPPGVGLAVHRVEVSP